MVAAALAQGHLGHPFTPAFNMLHPGFHLMPPPWPLMPLMAGPHAFPGPGPGVHTPPGPAPAAAAAGGNGSNGGMPPGGPGARNAGRHISCLTYLHPRFVVV
jgi:hypothetical protein